MVRGPHPGVGPPEGHDPGLHLGRDLVGTAIGLGASIGERTEAACRVAEEPAVHGPAVHPVAAGDVGDRSSRVERLSHGQVAPLNHRKLHKHAGSLLGSVEPK